MRGLGVIIVLGRVSEEKGLSDEASTWSCSFVFVDVAKNFLKLRFLFLTFLEIQVWLVNILVKRSNHCLQNKKQKRY